MARRFGRRRRVQWLPSTVTNISAAGAGNANFYFDTISIPSTNEERTSALYTLVPDYPASAIRAAGQIPSLGDWEGSAYRLRRLVGTFQAAMSNTQPPQGSDSPIACVLTACFMVIRVDEAAGAPLRAPDAYSPQRLDNIQDPFIWRRSWVLQNDFSGVSVGTQSSYQFARSNVEFGDVRSGPHFDCKVGRVIKDEERLVFIVSTTNVSGDSMLAGEVRFMLDWRVLASAVTRAGNRGNASR